MSVPEFHERAKACPIGGVIEETEDYRIPPERNHWEVVFFDPPFILFDDPDNTDPIHLEVTQMFFTRESPTTWRRVA